MMILVCFSIQLRNMKRIVRKNAPQRLLVMRVTPRWINNSKQLGTWFWLFFLILQSAISLALMKPSSRVFTQNNE